MAQNSKLEEMGADNTGSDCRAGELRGQRISVMDHVNRLQQSTTKSESFVVDMERFSHIIEKEINANSRITLQRNLPRKGSIRVGEKKISGNDRDTSILATSSRATLHGSGTPEKPAVLALGTTDYSVVPQVHHQITITNGSVSSTGAPVDGKPGGKRFSFRRSQPTWPIDPRRILFFFATLSCMGTIVLIYFTLYMGKLTRDDSSLN